MAFELLEQLRNPWNRRRVLRGSAATMAALAAARPGRLFAADKPTVANSIRSLSNPYHATWNKGGAAFAASVGADYVTMVTEGNSEKGVSDIKALLAKTGGNLVLNVDPNDSPDARPIVEQLFRAYLRMILDDGVLHADPHPGNLILTDDGRLALIDLGMVAHVPPRMQDKVVKLLLAISDGDGEEAALVLAGMGHPLDSYDAASFRADVSLWFPPNRGGLPLSGSRGEGRGLVGDG